jgi:3-oxoacid CoA-transferase subunit A
MLKTSKLFLSGKIFKSAKDAIHDLKSGSMLLVGGFGLCGIPENLITEVSRTKVSDLTAVSNNGGVEDFGLGILMGTRQLKRMISSYLGENGLFERLYLSGQLELELVPQGTLAERIRAGGAGIPAFYTPTGVGTVVAEGKETRNIDGRDFLMERALTADFAFVRAYKADRLGNLIYRKASRNFNEVMATAGKITIVEVEEIVEVGELDPESIVTPAVYVDRIVQAPSHAIRWFN